MFNNPYMQRSFNQQNMYEQIDNQINQLNHMKEQMKNSQQQPSINQTFQLAPNSYTMRYANTIEDVNKETVYFDTPFFSKDMSVLWLKGVNGNIKTYELSEIIPKDAKDIQIEILQSQIEELKGMIRNESNDTNVSDNDTEQDAADTSTDDESTRTTTKDDKSTNVQKISRSKAK